MWCHVIVLLIVVGLPQQSYAVSAPKLKLWDGKEIPSLALGTWLGNNTQGRIKPVDDEVEKAVASAIDLGYRHIDTAWAYQVEDQVGKAVNDRIKKGVGREELFITTKLWNDQHAREAVVPALRKSLEQLQLDYVDLYLIHWPVGQFANLSYDYTDYLDTWRGMVEAKQLGLARSIGVSNFNQQQMDRLLENGLEKPVVLQVEAIFLKGKTVYAGEAADGQLECYKNAIKANLNLQQPALLSYCRQKNITVMAYTPFGSLFPSKARADAPPPRLDDQALVAIAQKHNKTVTQVVLRYLLDLGVIPIPKALNLKHMAENIDVFDFTLSVEDSQLLLSYDKGYRTIPQLKWIEHPYYPFLTRTSRV